jgi:hypothetical protein
MGGAHALDEAGSIKVKILNLTDNKRLGDKMKADQYTEKR